MSSSKPTRRRIRISWEIHTPKGILFRTKFFKLNDEHLAIHFMNQKLKETGIFNVKRKEVSG